MWETIPFWLSLLRIERIKIARVKCGEARNVALGYFDIFHKEDRRRGDLCDAVQATLDYYRFAAPSNDEMSQLVIKLFPNKGELFLGFLPQWFCGSPQGARWKESEIITLRSRRDYFQIKFTKNKTENDSYKTRIFKINMEIKREKFRKIFLGKNGKRKIKFF